MIKMKYIEIRRHSIRRQTGAHLTQEGVSLARSIGETMGNFSIVVTSPITRAFETAIAMGYAVDDQIELISTMGEAVSREIDWDTDYAEFSRVYSKNGELTKFSNSLKALIISILKPLSNDGRALMVTHSGLIQAAAVACMPDADHAKLGNSPSYCEGIGLFYDGEKFRDMISLKK